MSQIEQLKDILAKLDYFYHENQNKAIKANLKNALTNTATMLYTLKKEAGLKCPILRVGTKHGGERHFPIYVDMGSDEIQTRLEMYVYSILAGRKIEYIEPDYILSVLFKNLPIMEIRTHYLHALIAKYQQDFEKSRVAASRFFGLHPVCRFSNTKLTDNDGLWFFAFFYLSKIYGSKITLEHLDQWESIKRPEKLHTFSHQEDYCIDTIIRKEMVKRVLEDFNIRICLV